jgi:hypothetical protein
MVWRGALHLENVSAPAMPTQADLGTDEAPELVDSARRGRFSQGKKKADRFDHSR